MVRERKGGEEGREGLSAERRFKVCKLANKSKGEVELLTLECCSLTDNCGNRDNSLTHYTNDNKHVSSQCHSHTQIGASVVRSIPKAYTPSPNYDDSVYDSIYSRSHSSIRTRRELPMSQSLPALTLNIETKVGECGPFPKA